MAPVVTLSTGFEVSTEGLFSTERTKMKTNRSIWPRLKTARPIVRAEVDVEAEMVEQARLRRSRTPVRKVVPVHEEEKMRSPSPVKRGVASARHSQSIRTADVVGYKIVNDDANDMHAEFRIDVQIDRGQWTMHRRFNDFCDLHQMLVLQQPQCAHDVSLPPKRYFKRNKFDPAYLERRRRQLDAYLREVLSHDVFSRSLALRDFMSANWHATTTVNTAVGAEAAGRGERGGGAGARAGGGGSLTAMSPRQIRFAIVREQNKLRAPPAAAAAPSAVKKPAVPLRVRVLRGQPDFEMLTTKGQGTPTEGAESGSFKKTSVCDFVPPASCRSLLVCPTIDAPVPRIESNQVI